MKNILAVLAVALVAAVAQAAESSDISIADLKAAVAAKTVTLLDANGSDSWQAGHIPGAIDFAAQKAKLASLLPQDKGALIVAYCGGPKCGAYKSAAAAAKKLGYTNVKHLSAGISGWKKAGEAVEKGN
jgi:rhodanese-related sulfurtransferase